MPHTPAPSYRPYRLELHATLRPEGPWRVGSGVHYAVHSDMPLLLGRNGDHLDPYVPGSSLKGVLRDWLSHERGLLGIGQDALLNLFGRDAAPNGTPAAKGRLDLFDATPASPHEGIEVRDSVRIHRASGAADYAGKFDAEVALRGGLRFRLVYEGDSPSDPEMLLLREALRFLSSGLVIGGRGAVGYGRMSLDPVGSETAPSFRSFQRDNLDGLLRWLHHRTPGAAAPPPFTSGLPASEPSPSTSREHISAAPASVENTSPYLLLTCHVDVVCEGPVLIRSAAPPGTGDQPPSPLDNPDEYYREGLRQADATPLLSASYQHGGYYLPGSSLRGVARSIAERIPGCGPLTTTLFGEVSGRDQGLRGAVSFDDGPLAAPACLRYLDHVAVCRVLGFPASGAKFSAVALESPVFQNVIRVQVPPQRTACLQVLQLVLRDLACGLGWVGSGSGRGYGKVVDLRLRSCSVEGLSSLDACRDGRVPGFTWTAPPHRPGRRLGVTTSRKAMLQMLAALAQAQRDSL